ncbi:MAG: hypothetical protein ABMA02_15860 [Saprospiraceae bacterium]
MKNARVSLFALAIASFACTTVHAQAVKPQPAPAGTTVQAVPFSEDPNSKAPFCELAIPKATEDLQSKADKSCQTASTCVRCTDKASGVEVYATVYAQPKIPRCNVVNGISYDQIGVKPLPVYVEILQSVCTREGVTLEVSFPNSRVHPNQYDIEWEVDNRSIGKGELVNCVCGKAAKVTITEKATGRATTKRMNIANACALPVPASKN